MLLPAGGVITTPTVADRTASGDAAELARESLQATGRQNCSRSSA
jgi:hypothetical protein